MGYAGKVELQYKARELRKKGHSIRNIERKLDVSRSSVSLWVRDMILSEKQKAKLYSNKVFGGLQGSYIASQNKIKKRIEITEKITKAALKEVGVLSSRDRFIAGIALYFGEGSKQDKSVSITNANPHAMKFAVEWLCEFGDVSRKKIALSLYIHDNLDEKKAKRYWSNILRVDESQFRKSYIVKNNTSRYRKSKHKNGVLKITVSNVNLHRRIMGWISGVFEL